MLKVDHQLEFNTNLKLDEKQQEIEKMHFYFYQESLWYNFEYSEYKKLM
jgi:hypothetical protein